MTLRRFAFLILITFAVYPAMAATYYINSRTGNDQAAGTSRDTPWKSLKNLNKNIFSPGDSILFAKGSSYTGGFTFNCSGTPEAPIVFSSYSAGKEIITTTAREKLDSLFIKYGVGPAPSFTNPDWEILHGNIFHISGSYIIIDGLYFHDNAYPPGSNRKNKNVQKMGVVYFALGANHNVVRNCEFFHAPVAIKIKGSYNLITHNYLHDATDKLARSWGPIAIMIVQPYNEICYNKVINYGSYGGPYGSDGGVIELDGVDDHFKGKQIHIHHNISINNHGFLELAGRDVDSITIAYNLSDDTNQFIGGGSMKNIFVFNNTIIRTREPNVDRYVFWTFDVDHTSMVIRNNIFVVASDIKIFGPVHKTKKHQRTRVGNQVHDHNLYFSMEDNNQDLLGGIAKGKGDIIGNPMFIDFKQDNFRLQSNSPARNSGIKIKGNYTNDLDGYRVRENKRPDMGAY